MTGYGCCEHCMHGPGYIHTHPCLSRMHATPREEVTSVSEPTEAEQAAAQDEGAEVGQDDATDSDAGATESVAGQPF